MCSLFRVICLAVICASAFAVETNQLILRVAADPNNLPFSNERLEGFENRIVDLIAKELGAQVQYHWRAQRRGFFRETLKANEADLVMGVPADFERAAPTQPYYTSSYVFVTKKERALDLRNLDDAPLRKLKIGVQVIGDDGVNTPPAHALAARGIIDNVVGYSVYGDYSLPNPTARIIEGVANGEVDLAIAWGPLAGYFAPRQRVPLHLDPLMGHDDLSGMQFTFGIGVGVRNDNPQLRDEVNAILAKRHTEIDRILDQFNVPRPPDDARATTQEPNNGS